MDVAQLRTHIPTCQRMIYLNTGWSGPSPASVIAAITQRLEYENYEGPTSPVVMESGEAIQMKAREAVAGLLNATPEEVCLTESTTEGLNIVINGLLWQPGDEVITFDLEHPAILIPCYYLQQRRGVVVRVLPIAPDEELETIVRKVEGAITGRTRLVTLSHIQYCCGLRMPVEAIRELTRPRGILMLLDGAQAAGHISLDMRALDCDFYAIPGQKWLLGPEGVGALYVRQELIPQVQPSKVSFWAVTSFDGAGHFEPEVSSIDKLQVSATSVPLRAGLVEGIRFIQEVGVGEIESRDRALAAALKRSLQGIAGVTLLSPADGPGASGLVSFSIAGVAPEVAVTSLWEGYRIVARSVDSPPCIRLSLHFFNTEEEVAQVAEVVRSLAG